MTILELLEAHTVKRPWSEASRMRCKCGDVVTAETEGQLYALHRSHLAEVLETRTREREAAALEEAAAELAQESDAAFHTARKLSGDDNTRYHAYSSAYSVAAYKLENRAAQLKEQP